MGEGCRLRTVGKTCTVDRELHANPHGVGKVDKVVQLPLQQLPLLYEFGDKCDVSDVGFTVPNPKTTFQGPGRRVLRQRSEVCVLGSKVSHVVSLSFSQRFAG